MIDLKGMRVVYGERIYRALAIVGWDPERQRDGKEKSCEVSIRHMAVMVLNEDGQVMILDDEAWMFQFLAVPERKYGNKEGDASAHQ